MQALVRCLEVERSKDRGKAVCVAKRRRVPFHRFFETFSYLPPLRGDEIAKQVDYITGNGWVPCLEFADPDKAYVDSGSSSESSTLPSNLYPEQKRHYLQLVSLQGSSTGKHSVPPSAEYALMSSRAARVTHQKLRSC